MSKYHCINSFILSKAQRNLSSNYLNKILSLVTKITIDSFGKLVELGESNFIFQLGNTVYKFVLCHSNSFWLAFNLIEILVLVFGFETNFYNY